MNGIPAISIHIYKFQQENGNQIPDFPQYYNIQYLQVPAKKKGNLIPDSGFRKRSTVLFSVQRFTWTLINVFFYFFGEWFLFFWTIWVRDDVENRLSEDRLRIPLRRKRNGWTWKLRKALSENLTHLKSSMLWRRPLALVRVNKKSQ